MIISFTSLASITPGTVFSLFVDLILKDNNDAPKTNAVNRRKDSLVFNSSLMVTLGILNSYWFSY